MNYFRNIHQFVFLQHFPGLLAVMAVMVKGNNPPATGFLKTIRVQKRRHTAAKFQDDTWSQPEDLRYQQDTKNR